MSLGLPDPLLEAPEIFTAMLVTVGPLKAMLVYGEKTQAMVPAIRQSIATKTVRIATLIGILFMIIGDLILKVFHFSLGALSVSGGIILFLFSLNMVLSDNHSSAIHDDGNSVSDFIAVYPLAIPLMITPVGIVTLITISASYHENLIAVLSTIVIFLTVMVINFLVLSFESKISTFLSPKMFAIAERLLGIILAAFAVQVTLNGLQTLGLVTLADIH